VKQVTMSREPGGPWTFEFSNEIRQRDVNHLRRMLVAQYNRSKLRARIERKRATRLAAEKSSAATLTQVEKASNTKDQVNASA